MRQVHRAGEKSFIDFSGKRPSLVDRRTGELRHVELFVAVLGASSFTYAEATETQQLPDWVNAHVRMVEYFGGAATLWVPDQLKSAITRPCRYEPGVNRTYEDLAAHYGAVVVPARPRKPRGQGCCRELCTRGPAVDTGPAPRPDLLRARPAERRDPRPARRAQRPADEEAGRQPPRPLRAARRPGATAPADHALRIDYHVEVERHAYSVPYQLIREQVEVRYTTNTVEIFHRGKRVASHRRRYDRRPSTEAEHTSANGSNQARMTNWSYGPDLGVHRGRDGAFRGIARRHGDSEALERGHRRAPVPPEEHPDHFGHRQALVHLALDRVAAFRVPAFLDRVDPMLAVDHPVGFFHPADRRGAEAVDVEIRGDLVALASRKGRCALPAGGTRNVSIRIFSIRDRG